MPLAQPKPKSNATLQFKLYKLLYIYNRTYNQGVKGIPFELKHDTIVDLSHIRIFGCPAYVHIDKSQQLKPDLAKAWKGIQIGYSEESKAYLIYNPATNKVISTRSVSFDEGWRVGQPVSENMVRVRVKNWWIWGQPSALPQTA